MATKTIKYEIGEKVSYDGEIPGKITAIHLRGEGASYEFSFLGKDGIPASVNVQECEIEAHKETKIGFKQ